jgi:hypothetical protein
MKMKILMRIVKIILLCLIKGNYQVLYVCIMYAYIYVYMYIYTRTYYVKYLYLYENNSQNSQNNSPMSNKRKISGMYLYVCIYI